MRIGAFELHEPIPDLNEPYAFAILQPWIDVNGVGSLTLGELESQFGAKELGKLAKPGTFFDFTRYRPMFYFDEGIRRVSIPNTILRYTRRRGKNDLLFFHLLEAHAFTEVYVDSVLRVLSMFRAKKYCLLGSMYDTVPHTRPLIVYGGAIGIETVLDLKRSGAQPSDYQGPTSMMTLISQRAPEFGTETIWFIVSLPQYIVLEEDYVGKLRLMEILNVLYKFPIDKENLEKAAEQRAMMNQRVEKTPNLKHLLPELEAMYEVRTRREEGGKRPELSPEREEILWRMMGNNLGKA